ncbi:MAG TPA: pitrilysin family protein [Bryobacteraceae bacterium]|nr:pitrilysin family protein [Bryobacteraceae bacterium]
MRARTVLLFLLAAAALLAQSPQDLKFPPLAPVQTPHIETYTLASGLRVYLLENHELPLVSGLALVRTGNLFDPPEKVGLATLTGMTMRSGGTRDRTGDQLDEALENIAASVETSIGESAGQVSFSALRENTREVLGLFRDVLTAPQFRQDKIDLARMQLRGAIARRNDDAEGIAAREFTNILYGRDTPYGWQMEYATLDRIRRDDLVAFYQRYFFPSNVMLAVYGDFSTPEMKAELERLFGSWTARQPSVPPFPAVKRIAHPGIYLGVKPDVNQTVFYLGHLGGELRDPDEPALEIMANILGGGFSSRLFKRVRTALGYAYGIGADWGAGYDHPGLFEISGSTKSETTTAALRVVREEIERLRSAEVTDAELDTARQTAVNSFVFNFDTPAKTLSRLLRYEYYGYPRDFIFQFQKALSTVTKADVLRAARRHLRPEDITIVAVGNPAEFGEALTALGQPVHTLDLTIPPPAAAAAAQQ